MEYQPGWSQTLNQSLNQLYCFDSSMCRLMCLKSFPYLTDESLLTPAKLTMNLSLAWLSLTLV